MYCSPVLSCFVAVLLPLLFYSGSVRRTGRRTALFPFFPLTFIVGYQADLAYGTKIDRIRGTLWSALVVDVKVSYICLTIMVVNGVFL